MRQKRAGGKHRRTIIRFLPRHVPEVGHHLASRADLLRHLRTIRNLPQKRRLFPLERFEHDRRAALCRLFGEALAGVFDEVLAQLLQTYLWLSACRTDDQSGRLQTTQDLQHRQKPLHFRIVHLWIGVVEAARAARRGARELPPRHRPSERLTLLKHPFARPPCRDLHGGIAVRLKVVKLRVEVISCRDRPPLQAQPQLRALVVATFRRVCRTCGSKARKRCACDELTSIHGFC